MPLITTIAPEQAEGTVAAVYAEIQQLFGFVPNAIRLDSINPEHMSRHWNQIKESIQHSSLSQKLFTLIRYRVSEIERCEYCIGLNGGMLIQMHGMTQEQLAAVSADPATAPLADKEKALLQFVVRAVKDSNGISAEDMQGLREAGCTEREIFDSLTHGAQQMAGDIVLNTFKVEADLH
jgi:uncharacterized peroxidase-related enzyme